MNIIKRLLYRLVGASREVDELKKQINDMVTPTVKTFEYETGMIRVAFQQNVLIKRVSEELCRLLKGSGAVNYLEIEMQHGPDPFIMTLQKRNGKTPHQLRVEAELTAIKLAARVAVLEVELMKERTLK